MARVLATRNPFLELEIPRYDQSKGILSRWVGDTVSPIQTTGTSIPLSWYEKSCGCWGCVFFPRLLTDGFAWGMEK